MMLFFETFRSIHLVAVFVQVLAVASAVSVGHLARSAHTEGIYDAAQIAKRSLAYGATKRALGGIRPTMLVAEQRNSR